MAASESIDILREKMEPQGFSFAAIQLGQPARNYMRISSPSGNHIIVTHSNPLYPFATSSSRTIYKDKRKTQDLAQSLGVQVPQTLSIDASSWHEKRNLVEQFLHKNSPVVVKPNNSHGARGMSLAITTLAELERAINVAAEVDDQVLVQRQFDGEELRFTTMDGRVKAVLLRQKAAVVGDGIATLQQLIEKENEERANVVKTAVPYPQLDQTLVDKNLLNSDKVIALGKRVELNKGTMIRTGASLFDVTHEVNQDYVAIVERLAAQFGPGFLAIDMMIADHKADANTSNHILLEINVNPALSLFYSCRDGKHVAIVEHFLADAIQRAIDGRKI